MRNYFYSSVCIDDVDAAKIIGINKKDFGFSSFDHGNYIPFPLTEEALQGSYKVLAEIKAAKFIDVEDILHINNQIKLIEALRDMGYKDSILIAISW